MKAAKRARTENDLPQAVAELVKPFGWTCASSVLLITEGEKNLLEDVLEVLQSKKAALHNPVTISDVFWRIVSLPTSVLQVFASVNDAKALACFLMPSTARFCLWHNLAGASFNDTALAEQVFESLMGLPAASPTCCGAVYQVRDGTGHHLWFGRRAGQRPALSDQQIVVAIRRLFSIGGE